MTAAATPGLRYGVVLDNDAVNAWQAEVLDQLERSGDAQLVIIVVATRGVPSAGGRRRGRRRKAQGSRSIAASALELFGTQISRSKSLRPARRQLAPGVPRLTVTPAAGSMLSLPAGDVEAIQDQRLDFLLCLGARPLAGDILRTVRHGVWAFRHGEASRYSGRPPGFWEILDGQSVVGAALVRLAESPEDVEVLRDGWFATAPESYALTRDRLLLGPASWPLQVCRAIRLGLTVADGRRASMIAGRGGSPRIGTVLRFLLAISRARLGKLWHHGFRHDDWDIGIVDLPVAALLEREHLSGVRWAPLRRGHYAADPFGRWDGSVLEVLFEDYTRAAGAASIAHRQWSRERGWGPVESALDIGSHLSYPFLMEHGGKRFMLPESRTSGELTLYRAEDAGAWRRHAALGVDGDVADATMAYHDGRWWLFAIRPSSLNPATELMIWFADQPTGPWTGHPLNPVLADVRSARPGGPFFTVHGQLYRPAQDCSTGYGDRLAVKRIDTLTTERFAEEVVRTLEPERGGPFRWGLHTLTSVGDVTLVDGKRWVWSAAALARAIRLRLRR